MLDDILKLNEIHGMNLNNNISPILENNSKIHYNIKYKNQNSTIHVIYYKI